MCKTAALETLAKAFATNRRRGHADYCRECRIGQSDASKRSEALAASSASRVATTGEGERQVDTHVADVDSIAVRASTLADEYASDFVLMKQLLLPHRVESMNIVAAHDGHARAQPSCSD